MHPLHVSSVLRTDNLADFPLSRASISLTGIFGGLTDSSLHHDELTSLADLFLADIPPLIRATLLALLLPRQIRMYPLQISPLVCRNLADSLPNCDVSVADTLAALPSTTYSSQILRPHHFENTSNSCQTTTYPRQPSLRPRVSYVVAHFTKPPISLFVSVQKRDPEDVSPAVGISSQTAPWNAVERWYRFDPSLLVLKLQILPLFSEHMVQDIRYN